jgi:2-dehydro-3-deoxyphosphooctonate aldolase (KDO 8-P synthase)
MQTVSIGGQTFGNHLPMAVIAGPCQLQSLTHAQMIAGHMAELCKAAGVPYVFKASFDKANRSSLSGIRGPGTEAGLAILAAIRAMGIAVLTDIHDPAQAAEAAHVVDVLQIPALLCRQTDILLAAGRSGCAVNVKKGQFMAPWDMAQVAEKIASVGNTRILLTERGTTFGYNTLVTDMRALPIMAQTGYPVIMDATHAVQTPSSLGGSSGGQRQFAPVLARAAVAVGVAGVFIETHEAPDTAPSDGPCMVPLAEMAGLIDQLVAIDRLVKVAAA